MEVVLPRAALSGGGSAAASASAAAELAAGPTRSRFAYADVMEQPRHEPAPSMQSDFFTEAARGGSGSNPRYGGGTSGRASFSKPGTSTASLVSDVAQKKFGNAKSISSDSFAERTEDNPEKEARLARFAGAASISSSDYYGGGQSDSYGGGGDRGGRSSSSYGGVGRDEMDDDLDVSASELVAKMTIQAQQDLEQLKGMAQSAGRMLSGLAASVMAELQER